MLEVFQVPEWTEPQRFEAYPGLVAAAPDDTKRAKKRQKLGQQQLEALAHRVVSLSPALQTPGKGAEHALVPYTDLLLSINHACLCKGASTSICSSVWRPQTFPAELPVP
jgi:hypothetical protein